jgi:methyl-accepting chemotaxis protein
MAARTPDPSRLSGLRLRFAVGGGLLAFAVVLVATLTLAWSHAHPWTDHAPIALLLSIAAGFVGAVAGHRAGDAVAEPLDALRAALHAPESIAAAPPLPLDAPAEIGLTARSVAAVARAFVLAREELAGAAGRIHAESVAIHAAASRRSEQSQGEAASINQTNTVAVEIADATQRTLQQADSVIEMAQRSEELSADGARVVAGAVRATGTLAEQVRRVTAMVAELSDRTSQIAEIVVTVQDLAEQTDLVALNASVEAAKAGEQGRGFAVVAMEMRQLAEQSRQAATQVRSILAEIDHGAQVSAAATEEGAARAQEAQHLAMAAGEALEGLILVIRNSAGAARQIAEAARRQTGDVQSMLSSFSHVVRNLNAGAEDARDLERSARTLAELSRALADRASGPALTPPPRAP